MPLYTNIVPSLCFSFFFQLVHRQTQFSCTVHGLTSVLAHLDRTGLDSIVFAETSADEVIVVLPVPQTLEERIQVVSFVTTGASGIKNDQPRSKKRSNKCFSPTMVHSQGHRQPPNRSHDCTSSPSPSNLLISQSGYRSSQKISKIQKCQHSHTFLMTQIRDVLRKWHPGSTVFLLTSRITEIV